MLWVNSSGTLQVLSATTNYISAYTSTGAFIGIQGTAQGHGGYISLRDDGIGWWALPRAGWIVGFNFSTNWPSVAFNVIISGNPAWAVTGVSWIVPMPGTSTSGWCSAVPDYGTAVTCYDDAGNTNWTRSLPGLVLEEPAVHPDGTTFCVVHVSDGLLLMAVNGSTWATLWTTSVPATASTTSTAPMLDTDNSVLYLATQNINTNSSLLAVNASTGAQLWSYEIADESSNFRDLPLTALGLDGAGVFTAFTDQATSAALQLIRGDGTRAWSVQFSNVTWMSGLVVDVAGNAHVFIDDSWYAFSPAGTKIFRAPPLPAGDKYYTPPALARDGTLFVLTLNGDLLSYAPTPMPDLEQPLAISVI